MTRLSGMTNGMFFSEETYMYPSSGAIKRVCVPAGVRFEISVAQQVQVSSVMVFTRNKEKRETRRGLLNKCVAPMGETSSSSSSNNNAFTPNIVDRVHVTHTIRPVH